MEDSIRFEKCIDFYYGIYKKISWVRRTALN